MRKGFVALAFLALAFTSLAYGQVGGDPCANGNKQSAAVAVATSATTKIITGPTTGGTQIYFCGWHVVTGASSTWQLIYGTSTGCTGTNVLTGVYPASSTIDPGGTGTQLVVPNGYNVCVVSTGTGGTNGYFSYIVQ